MSREDYLAGLRDGLFIGLDVGFNVGVRTGFEIGSTYGFLSGYKKGYKDSLNELPFEPIKSLYGYKKRTLFPLLNKPYSNFFLEE